MFRPSVLGFVVLPKISNPAHMANNAELAFAISQGNMEILKIIGPIENYGDHSFFPVFDSNYSLVAI